MKRVLSPLRQHVRGMLAAYVVLGLSLIPAAVVYFRVRANVETRERARFEREVREERAAIEQKIPAYVEEMRVLGGLFSANAPVSPHQWQKNVAGSEIQRLYPGIRALGYLERVNANERQAFLKRLRVLPGAENDVQLAGDRPVWF